MNGMRNLNEYGTISVEYEGSGTLTARNGVTAPCGFTASQMRDGRVVLLVTLGAEDAAAGFFVLEGADAVVGSTTTGWHLTATGLSHVNYLPPVPRNQPGTFLAYHAKQVTIETPSAEETSSSLFAIVNAIFVGNNLAVEHPKGRAHLRRVDDYESVTVQVRTLKRIDITAELEVELPDPETSETVADDICSLLSIASGTKVQWIRRTDLTQSLDVVRSCHDYRVTKPYCPLPVIDPRPRQDLSLFLTTTLPTYVQRRESWGLSAGLLDAYLDAKSETDYLQVRGVKLAVVMEMLKESFLQVSGYQQLNMPKGKFHTIVRCIKTELKRPHHDLEKRQRDVAYRNLEGLNRIPFGDVLDALCSKLQLNVPKRDRTLFVQCRNSLIHTGHFYCETAGTEERSTVVPHPSSAEEYFWLLHFLDRLFLRLVGYEGPYVDWSHPGSPVRRPSL